MTVTVTYAAQESQLAPRGPIAYQIVLIDSRGVPCCTMQGPTREACVEGFRNLGYVVQE